MVERPAATGVEAGGQRVEARCGAFHRRAHHGEVGALTTFEEGVVDGEQRVEVLVDRRRLDAEATGDLRQAEAVDALLCEHFIGDGENLFDGFLATPSSTVTWRGLLGRRHAHSHRSRCY